MTLAPLARENEIWPWMCGACGNVPASREMSELYWSAAEGGNCLEYTCLACGTARAFTRVLIEKIVRMEKENDT